MAFLLQGVIISIPLVFAKIIDSAIYFEGMDTFFRYVLIGLAIQLMALIASPTASYIVNKIGAESTAQLKTKLLTRIPVIKYETLKNTSLGYLLQLIESDLDVIKSLVISDFVDFISKVIYFIVVFIIVMKLHFTLSILMICVVPILIVISKVMIPKLQECRQDYIKKSEKVKNTTDEVFSGVLVIKLSNAFLYIHEKIDTVVTAHKKVLLKYIKLSVIHSHLFTSNLLSLSNFTVTILGAYLVIKGHITVGTITALLTYFSGLWGTYNFFISFWRDIKIKMISVDRVTNFFSLPTENHVGLAANDFQSLEIQNVAYTIDNNRILKDITVSIKKGDKVLITGDNGSGKSTLVRLIVGLIAPESGSIIYNGSEISDYNPVSLREKISYISSEPYIFSGNLEDNFFGKSADSDLIVNEKYTSITKNGGNLSSGEKKRLQLACGMLQESDIYILDEPLNFVDDSSKKEIIKIIQNEFQDKTLIVISHDTSLFDFCSVKYILKDGVLYKSEDRL